MSCTILEEEEDQETSDRCEAVNKRRSAELTRMDEPVNCPPFFFVVVVGPASKKKSDMEHLIFFFFLTVVVAENTHIKTSTFCDFFNREFLFIC